MKCGSEIRVASPCVCILFHTTNNWMSLSWNLWLPVKFDWHNNIHIAFKLQEAEKNGESYLWGLQVLSQVIQWEKQGNRLYEKWNLTQPCLLTCILQWRSDESHEANLIVLIISGPCKRSRQARLDLLKHVPGTTELKASWISEFFFTIQWSSVEFFCKLL